MKYPYDLCINPLEPFFTVKFLRKGVVTEVINPDPWNLEESPPTWVTLLRLAHDQQCDFDVEINFTKHCDAYLLDVRDGRGTPVENVRLSTVRHILGLGGEILS